MPQTPLFGTQELNDWLHRSDITEAQALIAEKVVWGWLSPILEENGWPTPAVRPDEPEPKLFSWALELGGIAHSNPEGLSRYQLEEEMTEYSSDRRDEILQLVAGGGTVPAGGAPSPMGSFPPAPPDCYPAPYC